MAQTNLSFAKVATVDTSGLIPGRIYFETLTGLIKVATSATETAIYGGVRNASWDEAKKTLSIVNEKGQTIDVDLSDVASAKSVTAALNTKVDKQADHRLMSNAEGAKLSGIAEGAEVNQNAFSNIKVGVKTISANAKTDTFEIAASENVIITADEATDKITISAKDTTYSEATTSTAGLMSAVDKNKLNGIANNAQVNVIDTVKVNGAEINPVQKAVDITVPVTGVKAGDKVLSVSNKELTATLGLTYDKSANIIKLTGVNSAEIASIDATDFIKDGMIQKVTFDPVTKELTITFNTDSGKEDIKVNLASLVDTYTAGTGIKVEGNVISINDGVVATVAAVNAVDAKFGEGFSSTTTVSKKIAEVEAGVPTAITAAINNLDVTDDAVLNQFVTSVSETDGKITVTRTTIPVSAIPSDIPQGNISGLSTALANKVSTTTTVNTKPLLSNITLAGSDLLVGGTGNNKNKKVDTAVEDLYTQVAEAKTSGVTSFAGKTGAITLKTAAQTNGSVNLAISEGKELSASIVGLGSAAYTNSNAYATKTQGAKADTAVQSIVTGDTNGTIKVDEVSVSVRGLKSAAFVETTAFDANGSATAAEANAKEYAKGLWVWATFE